MENDQKSGNPSTPSMSTQSDEDNTPVVTPPPKKNRNWIKIAVIIIVTATVIIGSLVVLIPIIIFGYFSTTCSQKMSELNEQNETITARLDKLTLSN